MSYGEIARGTAKLVGLVAATDLVSRLVLSGIDKALMTPKIKRILERVAKAHPEVLKDDPELVFGYVQHIVKALPAANDALLADTAWRVLSRNGVSIGTATAPGLVGSSVLPYVPNVLKPYVDVMHAQQTQRLASKLMEKDSSAMSFLGNVGEQALGTLAVGALTALGMAGANKATKAFRRTVQKTDVVNVLGRAIERSTLLKNEYQKDPEKVLSFATTIFNYAPTVASDPNLLSSVLSNALHGDSIDPMTIRTLMEMEKSYFDVADKASPLQLGQLRPNFDPRRGGFLSKKLESRKSGA
jgi:hypothetical protein